MEQIYYTQCPVGYGLGASNGFQVKRLSRGYPTSGDFRHLGLKAFPGGGRALAPAALRYRKDGEFAEVAWLTPRPNEYETERGLWGRPGGHFAHGLRLSVDELHAIAGWPAGLFDSPIWIRTDREPTRGRPPDELAIGPASLPIAADFAAVAALADGEDPDRLARLLTALAIAAREGRTLFLVDEPARLGPRVALLTFAFPEALRPDLTFSTYHDRPEELPGFRISGTIPLARPNRPALTAQGIVADLTQGTFEPPIEPAGWARTLAGWLTRHDPVDEADWSATAARARQARPPAAPDTPWGEDWLGHLHRYPDWQRSRSSPDDPAGWSLLAAFAGWLGRSGLADEWVGPRGPAWWLAAAPAGKEVAEARKALVAQATLRESWRGDARSAEWGDAVAAWFRDVEPGERDESIASLLRAAPRTARPSFARALIRGLTPSGADAVLDRLRADPKSDPGMLLPLKAGAAVSAILGGAGPELLRSIVEEAVGRPGATAAVLDAVESGLLGRPEALATLAPIVVAAFDADGPGGGREGLAWALRRGDLGPIWLGPALRPILADPGQQSTWPGLRDRIPEDLRPALARAVLAIAADDGLPDEAFRWAVEGLLLPLAPRPTDPSWAESYLRRNPSGLELLRRLVAPEYRKLGLLPWINQARGRGEVSPEQASRVDACLEYARALSSRDPSALLKVAVPGVPPEERGQLLGQMLAHVGGASLEGLPFVLGAVRQAWPDAFGPGAAGLRSVALPLAKCLTPLGLPPSAWLDRLAAILGQLGLIDGPLRGFEADGLAAEVVAAAPRVAGGDPWPLRQHLLRDDGAWRALAADVRRDLAEVAPDRAPEVLDRWDRQLAQDKPERFFELFLNAADARSMAAIVSARAADLKSLPPLPWWDHVRHAEAPDDLREGYARAAPLAPIEPGRLFLVRQWVEGPPRRSGGPNDGPASLSSRGLARWRCLQAVTLFDSTVREPEVRWPIVEGWEADLPIASLPPDDRYRFLAWVVRGLDSAESHQLARLASWLKKSGMKDPARLARWSEEIEGLAEVPDDLKLYRSALVGELRSELFRLLLDDKAGKGARAPGPGRA